MSFIWEEKGGNTLMQVTLPPGLYQLEMVVDWTGTGFMEEKRNLESVSLLMTLMSAKAVGWLITRIRSGASLLMPSMIAGHFSIFSSVSQTLHSALAPWAASRVSRVWENLSLTLTAKSWRVP